MALYISLIFMDTFFLMDENVIYVITVLEGRTLILNNDKQTLLNYNAAFSGDRNLLTAHKPHIACGKDGIYC